MKTCRNIPEAKTSLCSFHTTISNFIVLLITKGLVNVQLVSGLHSILNVPLRWVAMTNPLSPSTQTRCTAIAHCPVHNNHRWHHPEDCQAPKLILEPSHNIYISCQLL